MEKTFGATERHDRLIVYGSGRSVLIYGFGEENGTGYDYRQTFDQCPSADEIKAILKEHIDSLTDGKILNGFVWNGKNVYLSTENQFNFKAAYDVAVQTGGATLPVRFKLGEDEHGSPVYYVFTDMAEFTDFYTKALAYIVTVLNEGWEEKDTAKEWVRNELEP